MQVGAFYPFSRNHNSEGFAVSCPFCSELLCVTRPHLISLLILTTTDQFENRTLSCLYEIIDGRGWVSWGLIENTVLWQQFYEYWVLPRNTEICVSHQADPWELLGMNLTARVDPGNNPDGQGGMGSANSTEGQDTRSQQQKGEPSAELPQGAPASLKQLSTHLPKCFWEIITVWMFVSSIKTQQCLDKTPLWWTAPSITWPFVTLCCPTCTLCSTKLTPRGAPWSGHCCTSEFGSFIANNKSLTLFMWLRGFLKLYPVKIHIGMSVGDFPICETPFWCNQEVIFIWHPLCMTVDNQYPETLGLLVI